jgi:hypothetical protein
MLECDMRACSSVLAAEGRECGNAKGGCPRGRHCPSAGQTQLRVRATLSVKNKKPASGDFSYKWQGTDRRGKERRARACIPFLGGSRVVVPAHTRSETSPGIPVAVLTNGRTFCRSGHRAQGGKVT